MLKISPYALWIVASLGISAGVHAAPSGKVSGPAGRSSGRDAVAAAGQGWKPSMKRAVVALERNIGPVPANFGKLSVEARLAYLHARRNLNPTRFDQFHSRIGPLLAQDDRLRAGQAQDCRPISGLLPDTPLFRYLQFRRGLNPANFDIYHPGMGALLAEDLLLRSGQGCVSPIIIPPTPETPGGGSGGTPSPVPPTGVVILPEVIQPPISVVPEPGSLALILLGSAGIAFPAITRRWKNHRRASA